MLLRTLLMLVLALGGHAGIAAEPAPDTATAAEATSAGDTTADTDSDEDTDDASAEESDASAGSLDGEGFVPSVQISEDLSVSFPTDI